jgi:hypothetical protein
MESTERGPDAAAERIASAPVPPAGQPCQVSLLDVGKINAGGLAVLTGLDARDRDPPGDAALAGYESFRHRIL